MNARIYPGKINGKVIIPPSKSMAHRSIIAASLSNGISHISNVAYSEDIITTIDGMRKLGAKIEQDEDVLTIQGIKDFDSVLSTDINCNESGSTLRFFIPIFSLCNREISFYGKNRLLKRPQKIYEDIFKQQGLPYHQDEEKITISKSIKATNYTIKGDVSSQFITGLLYTLPLLKEDSTIKITPPFESKSYIDLSIEMLNRFNIKIEFIDDLTIHIKGNQTYKATDYKVEGDFSQLAFFGVLAAINNDLLIEGVDPNSKQGDKAIINILKDFNVKIDLLEEGYKVYKSCLIAHDIDLKDCPDLGPIVCVLGALAKGTTRIYNAGRLRIKESDRIQAMEDELIKVECSISSSDDEITIIGSDLTNNCLNFSSHKDHRIVMALSVLSTILDDYSCISDSEYINKSYPNFFEDLASLNIKVDIYEN